MLPPAAALVLGLTNSSTHGTTGAGDDSAAAAAAAAAAHVTALLSKAAPEARALLNTATFILKSIKGVRTDGKGNLLVAYDYSQGQAASGSGAKAAAASKSAAVAGGAAKAKPAAAAVGIGAKAGAKAAGASASAGGVSSYEIVVPATHTWVLPTTLTSINTNITSAATAAASNVASDASADVVANVVSRAVGAAVSDAFNAGIAAGTTMSVAAASSVFSSSSNRAGVDGNPAFVEPIWSKTDSVKITLKDSVKLRINAPRSITATITPLPSSSSLYKQVPPPAATAPALPTAPVTVTVCTGGGVKGIGEGDVTANLAGGWLSLALSVSLGYHNQPSNHPCPQSPHATGASDDSAPIHAAADEASAAANADIALFSPAHGHPLYFTLDAAAHKALATLTSHITSAKSNLGTSASNSNNNSHSASASAATPAAAAAVAAARRALAASAATAYGLTDAWPIDPSASVPCPSTAARDCGYSRSTVQLQLQCDAKGRPVLPLDLATLRPDEAAHAGANADDGAAPVYREAEDWVRGVNAALSATPQGRPVVDAWGRWVPSGQGKYWLAVGVGPIGAKIAIPEI